jgi:hypothetical protein
MRTCFPWLKYWPIKLSEIDGREPTGGHVEDQMCNSVSQLITQAYQYKPMVSNDQLPISANDLLKNYTIM